jgi:hypothetical protein
MSERLANALNFQLAWARTQADRPDRVFLLHPYQGLIVTRELQGFLQNPETESLVDTLRQIASSASIQKQIGKSDPVARLR